MADTQAIKDRIDIVQLIGEYVPLKKAGANWRANCPFHNEKSPSFMVHPEKQIWHCFGCGKGGDIFTFVQEIEGLEFSEALKLLAERAGVKIDTYQSGIGASQRNRLLEITAAAAYFFQHFFLEIPAAEPAREYLAKRGVKKEAIQEWQIGFAPDQWELLTKYLLKKGYGIEELVAAGLTIKRDGADQTSGKGYYDRFRGRIMFPIGDVHGNVIGFTGRVLVETEKSGGKYINTPQTMLYDKSRVLFGIHHAKREIKNKDLAVLVEGQMDVIACHQAGMKNVVAASGTALTIEQLKLLKRYTTNLAVGFDADAAGIKAGQRGIGLATEEGFRVKVIQLPRGFAKDADECIKKDPQVWFKAVDNAIGIIEWYFAITLQGLDRKNPEQKQKMASILLAEISRIPYAVERDHWLQRLSDELGTDRDVLKEELKKVKKMSSATTPQAIAKTPPAAPPSHQEMLLADFWSIVITFPDLYPGIAPLFKPEYARDTPFFSLYEHAETVYTTHKQLDTEALRMLVEKANTENQIDVLRLRPYTNFLELTAKQAALELKKIAERLQEEWRRTRGKEIERAIAEAEKNKDTATLQKLFAELQSLTD